MTRPLLTGKSSWQLGLAAFAALVVGGSAYVMSKNIAVNYKSGASNVVQTAEGKLVKKDTPSFSPCKDVTMAYALIGSQPETPMNTKDSTPPANKDKSKLPPACTPLQITSQLAEPLVGQRVVVNGTYQNGVFYGTSISAVYSPESSSKPSTSPKPTPQAGKPTPQGKNP